jgi:hypothetical protein
MGIPLFVIAAADTKMPGPHRGTGNAHPPPPQDSEVVVLLRPKAASASLGAAGSRTSRVAEVEVRLQRRPVSRDPYAGGGDGLSEASFDSSCGSEASGYGGGTSDGLRGLGIS